MLFCSATLYSRALNGGFQTGGVPDLDLSFLFLSLLGLSRFFWDFPDLLGDGPGNFPIYLFSLARPFKGTYEEQSRKGPRHNPDLSRKKWEAPPPVWKHTGLASPNLPKDGSREAGLLRISFHNSKYTVFEVVGPFGLHLFPTPIVILSAWSIPSRIDAKPTDQSWAFQCDIPQPCFECKPPKLSVFHVKAWPYLRML